MLVSTESSKATSGSNWPRRGLMRAEQAVWDRKTAGPLCPPDRSVFPFPAGSKLT